MESEESSARRSGSIDDPGEDESSDSPPAVPKVICGRFDVGRMIGSGSYSEVFAGFDRAAGQKVAIKLEWMKAEKGRKLLSEAKLYKSLGSHGSIPGIRWSGVEGEYNVMVMDLLGPSLDELFSTCDRRFSLRTVLLLAGQMIDCIEFVHSCGILHRDIKPHNFLMGVGERSERVYIMDFGLAKRFRDFESGEHIPCARKRGVTGTVRYASLNVHDGFEPSRRDDLEGIGNVLVHFLRGHLPWQGLKAGSKRKKHQKIGQCKRETSIEELCRGFPQEFARYFHHCRSLQYADRPDYGYLRSLMKDALVRECYQHDLRYDWMLVRAASDSEEDSRGRKRRRRHHLPRLT
mmetsp:Transcript_36352/g.73280  ORF Transcript_36352/g.73280 Transcript_36352/m.73280 type:complete len:348 (-) Transcript_36352:133-1176(-)